GALAPRRGRMKRDEREDQETQTRKAIHGYSFPRKRDRRRWRSDADELNRGPYARCRCLSTTERVEMRRYRRRNAPLDPAAGERRLDGVRRRWAADALRVSCAS